MSERIPTITPTLVDLAPGSEERLQRLRRLAWVMDRAIPIGRWRIGLDALIGLIPGVGDWVGAVISTWIIYEAARLGVPSRVLVRMGINVGIETAVGSVPLLGDVFDAAWQANQRNVRLIEAHVGQAIGGNVRPRSMRHVATAFIVAVVLFLILVTALAVFVARWAWGLVT